jgi:hypothetical protein
MFIVCCCAGGRELVLQAFQRRPAWRVTSTCGVGEEVARESSLLHWGEYERISWDAVHKGAYCKGPGSHTRPEAQCCGFGSTC